MGHWQVYRDVLVVRNRGKIALKCIVKEPKELVGFFEVHPHLGYVQSNDSFSFYLKLRPNKDLVQQCQSYGDPQRNAIAVPIRVHVPDQVQPIWTVIKARLTPFEIVFKPSSIHFGPCAVGESVSMDVQITNTSVLPQGYGFPRLPEHIKILQGKQYGTLLGYETSILKMVFSPNAPGHYVYALECMGMLSPKKLYEVPCTGDGVAAPLQFSPNNVYMPATPVGDSSTSSVLIKNLSTWPQSFEVLLPAQGDIGISPLVGTVPPKKAIRVQIDYYGPGTNKQDTELQEGTPGSPKLTDTVEKDELLQVGAPVGGDSAGLSSSAMTATTSQKTSGKTPPSANSGSVSQMESSTRPSSREGNTAKHDKSQTAKTGQRSRFAPAPGKDGASTSPTAQATMAVATPDKTFDPAQSIVQQGIDGEQSGSPLQGLTVDPTVTESRDPSDGTKDPDGSSSSPSGPTEEKSPNATTGAPNKQPPIFQRRVWVIGCVIKARVPETAVIATRDPGPAPLNKLQGPEGDGSAPVASGGGPPPETTPIVPKGHNLIIHLQVTTVDVDPQLGLDGVTPNDGQVRHESNGQGCAKIQVLEFGKVAVGQKVLKRFVANNLGSHTLRIQSNLLGHDGIFVMLNALRDLVPGKKSGDISKETPSAKELDGTIGRSQHSIAIEFVPAATAS
ncbi:hypothetical protein CBR_g30057 [Chara braunii]|uniref:MSP domain-containing protein n=1 Tax=Chara braunii TaxID=69332 RepID=A0A388LBU7_CHABU|nr:hypothetical protein CBR_g30057 [Chara braunii]|eukprot:GBG79795.1 hypothetical protein CBR_g30057 [Chara braunii]